MDWDDGRKNLRNVEMDTVMTIRARKGEWEPLGLTAELSR